MRLRIYFIAILSVAFTTLAQEDPVTALLAAQVGIGSCYSIDGRGNNIARPTWGSVAEPLLRPEGNSYVNGSWFNPPGGPNPRLVSNVLSHQTCAQSDRTVEGCINDWFWVWGQVIDHDITHVPPISSRNEGDAFPVPAVPDDPLFGSRVINMQRSAVAPSTSVEQLNLATAFLDASMVYGTTPSEAQQVRSFVGGQLRMSDDGFPPVISAALRVNHSGTPTFTELGSPHGRDQFLCADMRCNQHAPMAAVQTMFIREHNRIAGRLAAANSPFYRTDEQIFQAARALTIAQIQAVTYEEYLPLTLGRFNLPRYTGYDSNLRPSVLNSFSTAAFRVGHSMLGCTFKEATSTGQVLQQHSFAATFFDPTFIRSSPAQPNRVNREVNAYQTIMNGLAHVASARMDPSTSPALRSVVFRAGDTSLGRVEDTAFDVIALDIQRGRDHGLIKYNAMRKAMGWTAATQFSDITESVNRQRQLRDLYKDVDDIDLFVGLLVEDPLEGALMGPVSTSIIADQFTRIRNGDRCWYENQFSSVTRLLTAIRTTKLGDIVDRNFQSPLEVRNLNQALATSRTFPGSSAASSRAVVQPDFGRIATLGLPSDSSTPPSTVPGRVTLTQGFAGYGVLTALKNIATRSKELIMGTASKQEGKDAAPTKQTKVASADSGDDIVGYSCSRTGCEPLSFAKDAILPKHMQTAAITPTSSSSNNNNNNNNNVNGNINSNSNHNSNLLQGHGVQTQRTVQTTQFGFGGVGVSVGIGGFGGFGGAGFGFGPRLPFGPFGGPFFGPRPFFPFSVASGESANGRTVSTASIPPSSGYSQGNTRSASTSSSSPTFTSSSSPTGSSYGNPGSLNSYYSRNNIGQRAATGYHVNTMATRDGQGRGVGGMGMCYMNADGNTWCDTRTVQPFITPDPSFGGIPVGGFVGPIPNTLPRSPATHDITAATPLMVGEGGSPPGFIGPETGSRVFGIPAASITMTSALGTEVLVRPFAQGQPSQQGASASPGTSGSTTGNRGATTQSEATTSPTTSNSTPTNTATGAETEKEGNRRASTMSSSSPPTGTSQSTVNRGGERNSNNAQVPSATPSTTSSQQPHQATWTATTLSRDQASYYPSGTPSAGRAVSPFQNLPPGTGFAGFPIINTGNIGSTTGVPVRRSNQPAPGIFTTTAEARAIVPAVTAAVLRNNVFLLPGCRR